MRNYRPYPKREWVEIDLQKPTWRDWIDESESDNNLGAQKKERARG